MQVFYEEPFAVVIEIDACVSEHLATRRCHVRK